MAEFHTEAEKAVRAEIDTVIQEAQLSSTRLYQNVKLMDRRSTETAVQQEPLVRLRTCGELATVGLLLSSGSGHNAGSGSGCFPRRGRTRPASAQIGGSSADPATDASWVDMDDGPLRAGQVFTGNVPPNFVNELMASRWANNVSPAVRRAIAQAIAEQCVPWFVAYESWHAHVREYGRRSSRAAMLNQAHNDQRFEEFRIWVEELRAESDALRERIVVLQSQLDPLIHSAGDLDSEQLPLGERIRRAQRRAGRSRSPAPAELAGPEPRGFSPDRRTIFHDG